MPEWNEIVQMPEGYTTTIIDSKEAVDDSALELIPGEKFGPARFGMTVEQVIKAIGEPDLASGFVQTTFADDGGAAKYQVCKLNYASRGFELSVEQDHGLIGVICFGFPGVREFQGQFPGGIKMGDTPEDVRSVFGEVARQPNLNWGESSSDLIYQSVNNSTIRFVFNKSQLTMTVVLKKE